MRFKLGRPDIGRYADRFDVAPASPATPLSVTWLGVTSLLIDDGSSALMTDGFFSRPGLARVALGKVAPSEARIHGCLARAGARELAAVIPLHSHIDHAMDSAVVAERTGAVLVGGQSTANVGRGQGLCEDRLIVAATGAPIALGAYDVTLVESRHCPPDRFPGVITAAVVPPVRASAYKCGEAWSALVVHRPSGRSLLIMGSAGFVPGSLAAATPTWSTWASASSAFSPGSIWSTTGMRRSGPSGLRRWC